MKRFTLLFLFCAFVLYARAQEVTANNTPDTEAGIIFFEGSWAEAMARAKQEKKYIFVDFFTVW